MCLGQFSRPVPLISYARPSISSLSGCLPDPNGNVLSIVGCSRAGGDLITVIGVCVYLFVSLSFSVRLIDFTHRQQFWGYGRNCAAWFTAVPQHNTRHAHSPQHCVLCSSTWQQQPNHIVTRAKQWPDQRCIHVFTVSTRRFRFVFSMSTRHF